MLCTAAPTEASLSAASEALGEDQHLVPVTAKVFENGGQCGRAACIEPQERLVQYERQPNVVFCRRAKNR